MLFLPEDEKGQDELVEQFMMILNNEYLVFICDESERVVGFGLCFPGIGDAVKKSGGRLTLQTLVKRLKTVKKPLNKHEKIQGIQCLLSVHHSHGNDENV